MLLIVTGLNEGIVPKSRRGDMFLPDALRRRLHLEDNCAPIRPRCLRVESVGGAQAAAEDYCRAALGRRRSADSEPIAIRVRRCGIGSPNANACSVRPPSRQRILLPGSLRPGQTGDSMLPVPLPVALAEPITALRVTELRDYLACPYRYYLRRRLKLDALADWAEELDGAGFGNLLHDVLRDFSRGAAADSESGDAIREELFFDVGPAAAARFGEEPLAGRARADRNVAIAAGEVRRSSGRGGAAKGGRFVEAERAFDEGDVIFHADDGPISLVGRIDRIDVNERTGEVAVLDYKSSDSAKSPDQMHRQGPVADKQWIDFQLPLYRYLVRSLDLPEPVQLGYVLLPKDIDKTEFRNGRVDGGGIGGRGRRGRAVVRGIRAGEFWPPTDPPPSLFSEFAAICQDDHFAAAALTTDAEEESS